MLLDSAEQRFGVFTNTLEIPVLALKFLKRQLMSYDRDSVNFQLRVKIYVPRLQLLLKKMLFFSSIAAGDATNNIDDMRIFFLLVEILCYASRPQEPPQPKRNSHDEPQPLCFSIYMCVLLEKCLLKKFQLTRINLK